MRDLVKFFILAALVTVRRKFRTALPDAFTLWGLVVEFTELVLEKVLLWLKLESRVGEPLPRVGPWQGTTLRFL